MINFDEELKKYKPVLEVKEVEASIRDKDLTDMIDILKNMTTEHPANVGDIIR